VRVAAVALAGIERVIYRPREKDFRQRDGEESSGDGV
jgi:hypothetical protein